MGGHLEMLGYLRARGHVCSHDAFWAAIQCGHLAVLRHLHAADPDALADLAHCAYDAALMGHLEVLRFLLRDRAPGDLADDSQCIAAAAVGGHLEVLRFLHSRRHAIGLGVEFDTSVCIQVVMNGFLAVLQYMHKHGCAWDAHACTAAAAGGYLAVLKWLHEHRCPWSVDACEAAATYGHLGALKYLCEHGCEMRAQACAAKAMKHSHLAVLAYLEGCNGTGGAE